MVELQDAAIQRTEKREKGGECTTCTVSTKHTVTAQQFITAKKKIYNRRRSAQLLMQRMNIITIM